MRAIEQCVAGVEPASPAVDPMELQNPVHTLPQIDVPHGRHLPKTLPTPATLLPIRNSKGDALLDIPRATDQRNPGGLIQRLQRSDNRQQIEPLAPYIRFNVGGLDLRLAIQRPEHESPLPGTCLRAGFGLQQIMRCWTTIHRGLDINTVGNLGKTAQSTKMIRPRAVPLRNGCRRWFSVAVT